MGISGLYAIADDAMLRARGVPLHEYARALRDAGVGLVQWRCKAGSARQVLEGAAVLSEAFAGSNCCLILNDRVDLALLAGFDGVHVGQGDLHPDHVRHVVARSAGAPTTRRQFILGLSTHSESEVRVAESTDVDYVAVGPVFQTASKADAAPVVGLQGIRRARALTLKPLVAIGGITRENAAEVKAAGADAVAVISDLLTRDEPLVQVARDFIEILR